MSIIENSNAELIREFMALRDNSLVLEVNIITQEGSFQKLEYDNEEELRYFRLAKDNDGLQLDPQGVLEFRTDSQMIRLAWVDAQPSSAEDESLISAIPKPIL